MPEKWFVGEKVEAPGLPGQHRIDWLYSARGVSMEGDGIDLDGNKVHIEELGDGGWVNARGRSTDSDGDGHWSSGSPFWRAGGYWKSAAGDVTFPLDAGGWFMGEGARYFDPPGATFGPASRRPLTPYKSIAVDPDLIPMGSKVYISQYKDKGGWFTAADVGGAIQGRHVDVFRSPPASLDDKGQYFPGRAHLRGAAGQAGAEGRAARRAEPGARADAAAGHGRRRRHQPHRRSHGWLGGAVRPPPRLRSPSCSVSPLPPRPRATRRATPPARWT